MSMHDPMIDGGVIRKLWISEPDLYRDHLLRLDGESRRNRFGGGVSDDFIRSHVELSIGLDAVIHGFFVDGALHGAGELRRLGIGVGGAAGGALSTDKTWESTGRGP